MRGRSPLDKPMSFSEQLSRRLRPHWFGFLCVGIALNVFNSLAFPEPAPSIGPADPRRVEARSTAFATLAGRLPNEQELTQFTSAEIREELLFQEAIGAELHRKDPAILQRLIRNMRFIDADTNDTDSVLVQRGLALNLHLTDEVIRRRLIQGMSQLLIAASNVPEPTESELRAAWEAQRETLTAPARISFQQRFLGAVSPEQAQAQRSRIAALTPDQVTDLGVPFVAGNVFNDLTWTGVSTRFGPAFTRELRQQLRDDAQTATWLLPLTSTFGEHLVWVTSFTPSRQLSFAEAAPTLRRDLKTTAEQQALTLAISQRLSRYRVLP